MTDYLKKLDETTMIGLPLVDRKRLKHEPAEAAQRPWDQSSEEFAKTSAAIDPPVGVTLTGSEADCYAELKAAALASLAAQNAQQAAGVRLRSAFESFCKLMAPT